MDILQVKKLSIDFLSGREYLRAVSDFSLDVKEGKITALVGESGCGKSASCLSIAKLLPVPPARIQAQAVNFTLRSGETVDIFKLPPRKLRKIQRRTPVLCRHAINIQHNFDFSNQFCTFLHGIVFKMCYITP